MPLRIYTSNQMEKLVTTLFTVLKEPLNSPFASELIVVQSKGMQRWLSMELSRHFGVWANGDFPFPNSLVWRLFCTVLPEVPDSSPFSADIMTWKIMGLLPGFLDREEFSELKNYLAGDLDGLKLFQLSEQIADAFDQYTLFRSDMLLEWEKRRGGDWQEVLWRELSSGGDGKHRGWLKQEFCRKIADGLSLAEELPERISVFGVSYLPEYHMDVLMAISSRTEVNLFLPSPTREYWGDIVSARQKASRKPEERAVLTEGNPLLASLGKVGRDFSEMIVECGGESVCQKDIFVDTDGSTMLKAIQSDILNLRGAEEGRQRREIAGDDISIQIHSCHSPMREMEVLYDNILSLLDGVAGLAPRDILVMTPDIEAYAPYISTVFEGCQDPLQKIPFSIADRSLGNEGQVASVLLKLLALPGSRFTVVQVLDILESPPVAKQFDLGTEELDTIRVWLEETRVRWGLDSEDRARLGLPPYRENSWRAGIDRLLLGYAMPDEDNSIFNGILPYDEIEGNRSETLGKFLLFLSRIRDLAGRLGSPRSLTLWRDEIRMLLTEFIAADDDSAREVAAIADLAETMGVVEEGSGFSGQVEIGVIRSWLSERLARDERGLGFMTGGVTFCGMLPMRSIPFRVVALVGLNDGAFPRQGRPPGFDLIARNPKPGDRSLRDEDRYLFLESLLSTRDCFYISYVGQSVKDNSEIPPSVLVSELVDYIKDGFTSPGGDAGNYIVTTHRLQAFSSDYFEGGTRLFSYSNENCEALAERRSNPWYPSEFISTAISVPPDEWKDIPLQRLLRFFDNPSRFLLENRLGIRLEEVAAPLEEREPFAVERLDNYKLKQELVECVLHGGDVHDLLPVARCCGILPPAHHGEAVFEDVAAGVSEFVDDLRGLVTGIAPMKPLDFEISLGGFRLTGRVDRIWEHRMIRYRCAKMKAKDQIRTWIEHLVLNHLMPSGYPVESTLFMTGDSITFREVGDTSTILLDIFNLYWEGLTTALRFFPESSMAYAHKQAWDIKKAKKKWATGYNDFPGEGDDPYFRLCFGDVDPFDDDFERIARTFFEPLIQNLSEE